MNKKAKVENSHEAKAEKTAKKKHPKQQESVTQTPVEQTTPSEQTTSAEQTVPLKQITDSDEETTVSLSESNQQIPTEETKTPSSPINDPALKEKLINRQLEMLWANGKSNHLPKK